MSLNSKATLDAAANLVVTLEQHPQGATIFFRLACVLSLAVVASAAAFLVWKLA